MAEHSVNDLSYGHYGELFYDTEQEKWISREQLVKGESLQALGYPKTYHQSTADNEDAGQASIRSRRSARVKRVTGKLQRLTPGFGFADDTLEDHAEDLDTFAERLADDEWRVSDLLIHAKLQAHDGRRLRSYDLLAFPGGDRGDILRVVELRDARTGWGMDKKSAWLKTKEVRDVDSMSWQADGQIRQICFADNQVEERHPLLAVRTAKSVTVLLPRILADADARSRHAGTDGTPRIVLDEVVDWQSESIHNVEFVDLAFNPWFPSTLAAITEDGQFHLWTLLPFRRTFDDAETVVGESADLDFDEDDNGWQKIVWTSSSSFIICNRRRVKAFRRRGNEAICFNQDVLASDSNHIITDIRKSPIEDVGLFITTTSHIMYIRSSRDMRNVEADLSYNIVFSWRHNRDHRDTSLRLSFVEEQENGLKVMLLSRTTPLITICELANSSHDIPLQLTSSSTSISSFITSSISPSPQTRPTDIITLDAKLCGRLTLPGTNIDPDSWLAKCITNGYTFYQSFYIGNDLEFGSQLAYAQGIDLDREGSNTISPRLFIPAPIWTQVRKQQHRHDRTSSAMDDFIDADAGNPRTISDAKHSSRYSQMLQLGARAYRYDLSSATINLRVPFDEVCNELTKSAGSMSMIASDLPAEFAAWMEEAAPSMTLQPLTSVWAGRSLHRLDLGLDIRYRVSEQLTSDFAGRYSVAPLGKLTELGLEGFVSKLSPATLYDSLLDIFIRRLDRQNQHQETMTRSHTISEIAWQSMLASLAISSVAVSARNLASTLPQDQDVSSQAAPSSQMMSQTSEVVEEEEAQDSIEQAEEVDPLSRAHTTESLKDRIDGLRRYTRVDDPPAVQSDALALSLSDWTIGVDPATYDYEATLAAQAGTDNLEGSAMTAETSQRVKRKKQKELERDAKRRKLDERMTQSQSSQPSQRSAVPFMSAQPTRQLRSHASSQPFLSSQPADSQNIMASQPVPGRFGDRPATARKHGGRRGRRAGF